MARLLHHLKLVDETGGIEERVVWAVPRSERNPEGIRYRLAYFRKGDRRPAILYDNHHPKGHHKHLGDREVPYDFAGVEKLLADFGADVEGLR